MTKETDSSAETTAAILDRLFEVIESRRDGDSDASYTAKLLAWSTPKIAQKVGEEAVETVIEAMKVDGGKLAEESAEGAVLRPVRPGVASRAAEPFAPRAKFCFLRWSRTTS